MSESAIVINLLAKKYQDVTAVDDLTLMVNKGELFGLLGPNGAGKTTTLNILCGLQKPTKGSAQVCNYDVEKQTAKVKELIGVCLPVDAIPDYSKECQVLKNKPIIVNLADSLSDLLSNIEKYVKMRQTGKTFVYKMLRAFVDKEMYSLSAKLLGIRMQGDTIYFDNEEETSYQVNFLLYDYKVNRKNVVQKYQESNITKTKIENELLASMLSSYTSLFEVTSIRGFKVGLKDLFRIEDKPLQLIDIALQRNRNPWNVNICQTCPHR